MFGFPAPEAPPAKVAARSPSTARVAADALIGTWIGAIGGPPIPQKGEPERGIESPLRGTPPEPTRVIVRIRRFRLLEGKLRRKEQSWRAPERRGVFGIGRLLCAALLALTAAYGVEALLGVHGPVDAFFDNWVYNVLLVLASLACLTRGAAVKAE